MGGTVLFTPHLVPMTRGILATCYGRRPDRAIRWRRSATPTPTSRSSTSPDQPPATKWVSGSNGAQITARYDERTKRVLALSAIDNLGKGAAGQMIQCANLMLGLDETAGLTRSECIHERDCCRRLCRSRLSCRHQAAQRSTWR